MRRRELIPGVNMSFVRVVLGLEVSINLKIEELDVKIVFLLDNLDEEIYMEQSEGS